MKKNIILCDGEATKPQCRGIGAGKANQFQEGDYEGLNFKDGVGWI